MDIVPVTSQTPIKSDELQKLGARAADENDLPLEEALDVIGSTLKYAKSDITGQSKIGEGKAKRFLSILKARLARKASEQGGEVRTI